MFRGARCGRRGQRRADGSEQELERLAGGSCGPRIARGSVDGATLVDWDAWGSGDLHCGSYLKAYIAMIGDGISKLLGHLRHGGTGGSFSISQ